MRHRSDIDDSNGDEGVILPSPPGDPAPDPGTAWVPNPAGDELPPIPQRPDSQRGGEDDERVPQ